jgi:DNA-binding NarL/FixJ family response regulator
MGGRGPAKLVVRQQRDEMGTGFRAVAFELEGLEFVLFELEPTPVARVELSEAEHAVATLVLRGYSTPKIALERGVSYRTVTNQLDTIYRKLGVQSRGELCAFLRSEHDV